LATSPYRSLSAFFQSVKQLGGAQLYQPTKEYYSGTAAFADQESDIR